MQEVKDKKAEQQEEVNKVTDMITAEDLAEQALYAANAPDCCSKEERAKNMLGMLGANVSDDEIYHDEYEHYIRNVIDSVNEEFEGFKSELINNHIQQLYREILAVADENGGKLKNRCIFFCDEFGTLPKIQDAEMIFSASRSRRLQIVPIIQSFSQLEKNYGKEGGEIIVDNTQLTIFGGFAPNSTSAEVLSKALGSRTVLSGSVSRGKNDPSESLQMIERPLMTSDELKAMPKGQFVVMKTGVHPMKVKLKLFFDWGIEFAEPYTVKENANRVVAYASKQELIDGIIEKYGPEQKDEIINGGERTGSSGGQSHLPSRTNDPQRIRENITERQSVKTVPPSRRHIPSEKEV